MLVLQKKVLFYSIKKDDDFFMLFFYFYTSRGRTFAATSMSIAKSLVLTVFRSVLEIAISLTSRYNQKRYG